MMIELQQNAKNSGRHSRTSHGLVLRDRLLHCLKAVNLWKYEIAAFGLMFLAVIVGAASSDTVRFANSLNGDEGFEVTKALLWAQGYELYKDVWNNQPPLHTVILGTLFKLFGPSILVARALGMCFALLLLLGCFSLLRPRFGLLPAYGTVLCLISAPDFIKFSIAAMLEVPMLAVGMWSLVAIERWDGKTNRAWLVFSAFLLALALQVKLTAAVFGPAIICAICVFSPGETVLVKGKAIACNLTVFGIVLVGSFLLCSLLFGGDYDQMWASLFSPLIREEVEKLGFFKFDVRSLLLFPEACVAALVGALLIIATRDWRGGVSLITFAGTVFVVHFLHRPYWDYYVTHFGVALALLTGYTLGVLLTFGKRLLVRSLCRMAALVLLAMLCLDGGTRVADGIERIACLPRVYDSALVKAMEKYRGKTRWVYSRDMICVFHARLNLIPEIAILPDNRFWSRRITAERVWEVVMETRPEQLLLKEEIRGRNAQFVSDYYSLIYEDLEHSLFLRKDLLM